jgi:hypothetical protein
MKIWKFLTIWLMAVLLTAPAGFAQERPTPQRRTEMMERILNRLQQDKDGKLTADEFPGPPPMFERLDSDGDGFVTRKEVEGMRSRMERPRREGRDGRQNRAEMFKRFDRDGDGVISREEFMQARFPFSESQPVEGLGFPGRDDIESPDFVKGNPWVIERLFKQDAFKRFQTEAAIGIVRQPDFVANYPDLAKWLLNDDQLAEYPRIGRALAMNPEWQHLDPELAKSALEHSKVQQAGAAEQVTQRERQGHRQDVGLKAGDIAPDFTLKTLDGKETVTLSDSRGKKPVVLIFGSYT